MALITLPTGGKQSAEWTMPDPAVFVVRSGWTGKQTVGDLGGSLAGWQCKISNIPGRVAYLNLWRAFAAQMRGAVNTTRIVAVEADQVASASAVTITSGTSTTAVLSGLPVSTTGYLKAGSLATIYTTGTPNGARLVTLTADLDTNGSGVGTITFQPPLPAVPAGVNCILQRPFAEMRLVDGDRGWNAGPGAIYQPIGLSFEEVL